MANPKKPPALKMISGTKRKDRDSAPVVELPLVESIPPPPDWLPNAFAVDEWNKNVSILMANGLLTEAGLMPLANLCALQGKVIQLYRAGETPTASMISTLRNLQNDFGMTPVSQSKAGGVVDKKPANKFANNGQRAKG